jgi:hypothetical protein
MVVLSRNEKRARSPQDVCTSLKRIFLGDLGRKESDALCIHMYLSLLKYLMLFQ